MSVLFSREFHKFDGIFESFNRSLFEYSVFLAPACFPEAIHFIYLLEQ